MPTYEITADLLSIANRNLSWLFTEDFKTEPLWWDLVQPQRVQATLPESADLVIVGAGICGLSAAMRALDLGADTVVLDAGPIAGGATSRSGAMVSSAQKLLISGAAGDLDKDIVADLIDEHNQALDHIKQTKARDGVDTGFQASGRLFLAAAPRDVERFAAHARILRERGGMTARVVEARDLGGEIDTSHYHGGLLVEEFGGLHPSLFANSLAANIRRRGAILRSHTRVIEVMRDGNAFLVKSSSGTIRARKVLFATNGYTDTAMPAVRRRIAPVGSFMIATEELGSDEVARYMPGMRMYSDTKRNLWFFRPSTDGRRILFGARPGILPRDPRNAAVHLHGFMSAVFPGLKATRISHAWTGTIAMTRLHVQHIGERDGVWFAVGCNGSGITIMPWLGRLAVERMLGHRNAPTVFERIPFGMMPNLAGLPWYVPFAAGYFGFRDWLDRKRAGL
ncbi:FAD-binding oxidoreductase [Rhizobium sp. CG5]|uniref:NAD(P)/FAD-dependent oxidoreductase n=1 Tax=Rhizobium sp. CG5 TaxID=2726076 RepID=UPI002033A281|nr:FAD-binding oxidoreductase [Rhizobium sp. CG5]MCM2477289.1 FAD-binding oxidoreductase [Rhizobium sp. CG5]